MSILFGHPTGNPNSHQAALAHFDSGRLEAFCVPWMPSARTLGVLQGIEPLRTMAQRLARRQFVPLATAPKIQGRMGELRRLLIRAAGGGDESLSYEANDWLMRTMRRECKRRAVTLVHAYEDCSLSQFEEAKRIGKACVYDMPIGYYPAWEKTQAELVRKYADWLPAEGLPSSRHVRPEQKIREMELADLVLAPSHFVERTIRTFYPNKTLARAPYGVDLEFWRPAAQKPKGVRLRFIFAGQLSLRKGIPLLLEAWTKAALQDADLQLVGGGNLAQAKLAALPRGVTWAPPCSSEALRARFLSADVFVFPSFFEGFALSLLEGMACGLPVIASEVTDPDVLPAACGRLTPIGDLDALVEALRWFNTHRDEMAVMRLAVRAQAERFTWENYRRCVTEAVTPFV
ncbi:MAG: glycosyltransferase family 4 protein [Burkholderiales bacterium]|nr:glycosyltransferase family 4 protein [Burkholderiales bacterium]